MPFATRVMLYYTNIKSLTIYNYNENVRTLYDSCGQCLER